MVVVVVVVVVVDVAVVYEGSRCSSAHFVRSACSPNFLNRFAFRSGIVSAFGYLRRHTCRFVL
jgi:hypothetical protein